LSNYLLFLKKVEGGWEKKKKKFFVRIFAKKTPTVEQFAKTMFKIDLEQFLLNLLVFSNILCFLAL
jgi:hypothetical protein